MPWLKWLCKAVVLHVSYCYITRKFHLPEIHLRDRIGNFHIYTSLYFKTLEILKSFVLSNFCVYFYFSIFLLSRILAFLLIFSESSWDFIVSGNWNFGFNFSEKFIISVLCSAMERTLSVPIWYLKLCPVSVNSSWWTHPWPTKKSTWTIVLPVLEESPKWWPRWVSQHSTAIRYCFADIHDLAKYFHGSLKLYDWVMI